MRVQGDEFFLDVAGPPPGGRAWHGGPSICGAVRGVDPETARWSCAPGRRSIWELVLHAAYWKHTVARHLEGDDAGSFPRSPADWPTVPSPADARAWTRDRQLLRQQHDRLHEAVAAFPPRRLHQIPPRGKRWTYAQLIVGIANHDAYHTGQIQLIKRLAP